MACSRWRSPAMGRCLRAAALIEQQCSGRCRQATRSGRCSGYGDGVAPIVFSPDGQSIATASQDRSVRVWNAATGEAIRSLNGHEARREHRHIAGWIDDHPRERGQDAAVVGRAQRNPQDNARGARRFGDRVAYSNDGQSIASSSDDGLVALWDAKTGHPRWQRDIKRPWRWRSSPDGQMLASRERRADDDHDARCSRCAPRQRAEARSSFGRLQMENY